MSNGMNPMQMLMNLMNGGMNPQNAMNMLFQRFPQSRQMLTQLQNMAKGQNPKDFAMQLAKQNGTDPKQLEEMAKKFGLK